MKLYNTIQGGIFHARPNRFIAEVDVGGQLELCHVKNTGRCKELLIPGTRVYINRSDKIERVTKYDLVVVWKGERLVNMDSQAPNKVFLEYLQSGKYIKDITHIKPEAKYGDSRYDFYIETAKRKIFIEVKGVTLEADNIAMFPDAPTQRGIKHLQGLTCCISDGFESHVVFVIKMNGIKHFSPNYATHPEFGTALVAAEKAGVKISAVDCIVTPDSLTIRNPVHINMGGAATC
ncbi:MAG: DNA/RNA nuclease SfsA [Defluviitaleaceae bacterium]|nr:DNA/RNA nuclease SfsA [Defluviitaleaceae bacterium]